MIVTNQPVKDAFRGGSFIDFMALKCPAQCWRSQRDYGAMPSLMFRAALPALTFYLLLQRHFVKGLTAGAGRG